MTVCKSIYKTFTRLQVQDTSDRDNMAEVPQLRTTVESELESNDDDDDGMCDYEKRRLENIRKNHSILRSLGMILCRRDMIVLRTSQRRTPHYSGRFILIQWCPIYIHVCDTKLVQWCSM